MDIDEVVVPTQNRTWLDILDELQKVRNIINNVYSVL